MGHVTVSVCLDRPDAQMVGNKEADLKGDWTDVFIDLQKISGVHALYFRFQTEERIQFEQFSFIE